jgi:hypothetical protein
MIIWLDGASTMANFPCPAAIAFSAAFLIANPRAAEQKYVEGVFTATESGTPLELIAWAAPMGAGMLKMEQGFLEDAPVLPRTFRFLVNVSGFDVIAVVAVNKDAFAEPLDRLESKVLPHTTTKLNIQAVEIGVPELEDWDKVIRLRQNMKATQDKPLVLFIVVSNGIVKRFYPFFIDRQ